MTKQIIPRTVRAEPVDLESAIDNINIFMRFLMDECGFVNDGKFFYASPYEGEYDHVPNPNIYGKEYVSNRVTSFEVDNFGQQKPKNSEYFKYFKQYSWFVRKRFKNNKKCYVIEIDVIYDSLESVPNDFNYGFREIHYVNNDLDRCTHSFVHADSSEDSLAYHKILNGMYARKDLKNAFDTIVPDLVQEGNQQLHIFRPMVSIMFKIGSHNCAGFKEFAEESGFKCVDFGITAVDKNTKYFDFRPFQKGCVLHNQLRGIKDVNEITPFLEKNFKRVMKFLEID